MALTESIEYDKIEVVGEYKHVQVRKATVIKKDDVELTRSFERFVLDPGTLDHETDNLVDGYSNEIINKLISDLKTRSFKFSPVKRVYIPKGNSGKLAHRAHGPVQTREKIVHKGMLLILESIYDPTFSPASHGFRPGRSCHTALRDIRKYWSNAKWAISVSVKEGDIEKGCYDNIDHTILINIIRKKIVI